MKKSTGVILKIMNVLAWLAFAGFCVKACAILISFGVSLKNPEAAKNLYMGMNFSGIYQYDFVQYTISVSMTVVVLILEAYTAYLITSVLGRIKISNPFTMEISKRLEKISYVLILIWVAAMLANGHLEWLAKQIPALKENLIPGDFILVAGIVFVFAQIFKRGVEIQSENELTV